jgi:membrane protein required for colicin V production
MSWLDIVLLVILAVAAFTGLRAGLIKSVLAFAGMIAGIFLAMRFYDDLGLWLQGPIGNEGIANVVAFVAILLGVLLVATVLSSLLGGLISAIGIGWLNRLGGAAFGLIFAAISLGALLAALTRYPVFSWLEDAITGSFVASFLLDKFPVVLALLPPEFDSIREFFP